MYTHAAKLWDLSLVQDHFLSPRVRNPDIDSQFLFLIHLASFVGPQVDILPEAVYCYRFTQGSMQKVTDFYQNRQVKLPIAATPGGIPICSSAL
jgi:hypothetical protein